MFSGAVRGRTLIMAPCLQACEQALVYGQSSAGFWLFAWRAVKFKKDEGH